jgi:hypothetical protein
MMMKHQAIASSSGFKSYFINQSTICIARAGVKFRCTR